MSAPLGTWICNALENGGTLHVVKGKTWWYYATMFWPQLPDEQAIEGVGKTVDDALQDLNESLQEDAAEEMLNNPNSGV